jgi:hypothetical protein
MLRIARVQLTRLLLSVAISLSVFAATTPRAFAGLTPSEVATEVVIEDITVAMYVASVYAGGGMITTSNGMTSISPDGSSFTMSFTAGSIVYADTGTFTPDGVAPGTGTWTITATGASTIAMSGTQVVSYDPTTGDYFSPDPLYTFPTKKHPVYGMVNDFEGTWNYDPKTQRSTDNGYWTYNKTRVSPQIGTGDYNVPTPGDSLVWNQTSSGQGGTDTGYISGSWASGTFNGSMTAVPEPSSAVLAAIGAVCAYMSCRRRRWVGRGSPILPACQTAGLFPSDRISRAQRKVR